MELFFNGFEHVYFPWHFTLNLKSLSFFKPETLSKLQKDIIDEEGKEDKKLIYLFSP